MTSQSLNEQIVDNILLPDLERKAAEAAPAPEQLKASSTKYVIDPEIILVGDILTCQFGNPGDSNWTQAHAHAPVRVLAHRTRFGHTFLIETLDGSKMGTATVAIIGSDLDPIQGDLYCTTTIPADMVANRTERARVLGFTL